MIISIMSTKSLKKLAEYFNCTGKELISWVKCLNFIRNICAHNSNVIDVRLVTKPVIRDRWKENLFIITDKNIDRPTNRLAIVIYIIIELVNAVNDKYMWKDIQTNIRNICNNDSSKANLIGFANAEKAISIKNIANDWKDN